MKDGYAERVKQMTRSLEQLQAASERREAVEKKLRVKLEEELAEYRSRSHGRNLDNCDEDLEDMAMKLSEAEEKVCIVKCGFK